jgi:sulfonate transport system substrate-binding protein
VASDRALADPKKNTAVSDLLVRYAKAVKWAQDNPDGWAQSYAASVGLEPKVAAVAQGRSLRLPTALSDQLIGSEQELADLFAESGQLTDKPDFSKWVDHRYDETLAPLYLNRT